MKISTTVLNYLLFFAIAISMFSCKKDKDKDMGEENEVTCLITKKYTNDVLSESYEKISSTLLRINSYNENGEISIYEVIEKNSEGKLQSRSIFSENDEPRAYIDFNYNQSRDFPDYVEIWYYDNGDMLLNSSQVYWYNEGSCKLSRIESYDSDQQLFSKINYSYLDDNCSYNYKRYSVDNSDIETLVSELEYTYDSFKNSLGEFRASYLVDHNLTDCFDILNDQIFARGIYEYNEYGYPISEEATYTYLDGTGKVDNLRFEYDCE